MVDQRWLSVDLASSKLRKIVVPVLVTLKAAVKHIGDAQSVGLYTVVRSYWFLATLLFFKDVMPVLAKLFKQFQLEDVDFAIVMDEIPRAVSVFQSMLGKPGAESHLAKLPALIAQLKEYGIELTAARTKRNVRSALAAKEALAYGRRDKPKPKTKAQRFELGRLRFLCSL